MFAYNYLTDPDWEVVQTGTLEAAIHAVATRCLKILATNISECSYVHLASLLQVARDAKAFERPDLAQGFTIVRELKRTLRNQRPKCAHPDSIIEYPKSTDEFFAMKPSVWKDSYGAFALCGIPYLIYI